MLKRIIGEDRKVLSGQLIRYTAFGGFMCGFEFIALYIMKEYFLLSSLAAYYATCLISFILYFGVYSTFIFHSERRRGKLLVRYACTYIINTFIFSFIFYLFTELLHMQYLLSRFVLDIIIFIYNYFVNKYVVYK